MAPISTILDEIDRDDPNFFFENARADEKQIVSTKKFRDKRNERTTNEQKKRKVFAWESIW